MSAPVVLGCDRCLGKEPVPHMLVSCPHPRVSQGGPQAAQGWVVLCPVLTCFLTESWTIRAQEKTCASQMSGWGAWQRGTQQRKRVSGSASPPPPPPMLHFTWERGSPAKETILIVTCNHALQRVSLREWKLPVQDSGSWHSVRTSLWQGPSWSSCPGLPDAQQPDPADGRMP